MERQQEPDSDSEDDDEVLEAWRLRALSRNPGTSRPRHRTPRGGSSSSGVQRVLPEEARWSWPDGLVPGLNRQAMPSEDSWDKVVSFLTRQAPIVGQVGEAEKDGWRQVGRECVNDIWQALREACACEESAENACPGSCLTPCPACLAQRGVEGMGLPAICGTESQAKSRRLASLLKASKVIYGAIRECGGRAAKKLVEKALATAMVCSLRRLQQVASLGCLASVCPGLLTITGLTGRGQWAEFYVHLSKLGVAVKAQDTQPARAAVARAFFQRLRRDEEISDAWQEILRPGENR